MTERERLILSGKKIEPLTTDEATLAAVADKIGSGGGGGGIFVVTVEQNETHTGYIVSHTLPEIYDAIQRNLLPIVIDNDAYYYLTSFGYTPDTENGSFTFVNRNLGIDAEHIRYYGISDNTEYGEKTIAYD